MNDKMVNQLVRLYAIWPSYHPASSPNLNTNAAVSQQIPSITHWLGGAGPML
jgi:hypothetical protein